MCLGHCVFLGKVYQVLFGCLTPGSIGLVSYPVVAEAAVTQANPVPVGASGTIECKGQRD